MKNQGKYKPPRSGKRWAESELKRLNLLIRKNTSLPLIAWKLFGTEGAVRRKAADG